MKPIKHIIASPELRGDKNLYHIQEGNTHYYFCSPAVKTLIEDESLKEILKRDLQVIDVKELMKKEYEAFMANLTNKPKRKRTKKTDND